MTGIERLNACFKAFPEETKALLHHWIPCPPGMEDHIYHRELPDGTKMVSVTGLLNATILSDSGSRLGYVCASGDISREEELASIDGYRLAPESEFTGTIAPVPADWVSKLAVVRHTNKERFDALLRVVEFAKDNGFPKAETAFWDPDDPENGQSKIEDVLVDGDPGEYTIDTGIFLHGGIKFTKSTTPETDDTDSEDVVKPSEGEAP